MAEGDDKVGYKNPPRQSRFAKGTSGNPGGRPRKLPSLRSELEAELAEEIAVADDDDGVARITKLRGIAKAMVEAALRGDMRAVASIIALTRALSEPADTDDQGGDEELLDAYIAKEVSRKQRIDPDDQQ